MYLANPARGIRIPIIDKVKTKWGKTFESIQKYWVQARPKDAENERTVIFTI